MTTEPTISVVIPALNEARNIGTCVRAVRAAIPKAQIIVVDASSADGTAVIARSEGAEVLIADAPSRGGQCRQGADRATGDVLLFLHADCVVGAGAGEALARHFGREGGALAKLSLTYTAPGRWYPFLSRLARLDQYFANTGDNGIAVSRGLYDRVGGMPDLPLFEDVEFFARARRKSRLVVLDVPLEVSTRRFEANGLAWQLGLDAWLMTRYALGACPLALRETYNRKRRRRRRSLRPSRLLGAVGG